MTKPKNKPKTLAREVTTPAPAPGNPGGAGGMSVHECTAECRAFQHAIHSMAHGPQPVAFGTITFSTRKYPECVALNCARPESGTMKTLQDDPRDKCCGGCSEELEVRARLIGLGDHYARHCRQCGRQRARFFLVCPNSRWWNAPAHFHEEELGVARLIHDGPKPKA